ncbi:MAG TPA: SRPBCC domain-containing protein [Thermomicrobiales bacterium]|nr:SRPBCC domain-containing protein [Thermomicrobiales bacterium]
MKTLHFATVIDASPQNVWDTMLGKETYPKWVDVAWPGSSYHGEWKQGSQIRFTGADGGGGTLAEVTELDPNSKVDLHHIAVLLDDGSEDRASEMAKTWIGSTETYTFTPDNGSTKLDVELSIPAEWVDEFESGWPKAIEALKQLAEQ